MLGLTKKHQKFLSEPIGDKKVGALPGIGDKLASNLVAAGFPQANDLLGRYLDLGQSRELFKDWLKHTCGANEKQSEDCYRCLSDWHRTRNPVAREHTSGRQTKAKLIQGSSEYQGRSEEIRGLRETKKETDETEEESEEAKDESEYDEQIGEEVEEIEEEKAFQRNGKVQKYLGKRKEEKAWTQELGLQWKESEEEKQKVLNYEIQAREREYRMTLELSEKIKEMEEKMERLENKCEGLEKKIAEMEKKHSTSS